jgi:glycosyltransferase-like protein
MKIALLTHSVNPRGGVVHALELARALHEAGHAVAVFAPAAAGQSMFRAVPHRLELVAIGPTPPDVHGMVAARIAAFERHLRALPDLQAFDVWHAHDGIGGNALAHLEDAGLIDGFVRTVHHLDHFDDERVMRWQQRSFERARQVFCVSPLWCRTLAAEHGIAAELVANGVDLQRYRPQPDAQDAAVAARYGLRPGAPLWLAVGGVEERKNTLRILQAFMQHRQRHPQAQLVIAGGASLLDHADYQARFHQALAASGAAEAVLFTGTVADDAMPALFRLADGLLMPSLREGFGLVVLEALASLTPVVVSRSAPFTEYLARDDAHWADPLDVGAIAAAMDRALARPPTAVPEVCRRHSWAASAARHTALYRALRALGALA